MRLRAANPAFARAARAINPDGDAELTDDEVDGFRSVGLRGAAAGMLKPDVVFFGESVPPDRVDACFALVERRRGAARAGLVADGHVRAAGS